MKNKNIHAVKMLLLIVNAEGNWLRESWGEVLTCVSEAERLHLIATSNKPNVDVFVGESQVAKSASSPSSAPSPAPPTQQAASREKSREVDSVNAGKLLIDVALIERVFIQSANLNGDAIVDFVNALVRVSEHELSSPQPRVFSLQKIVEITYYNMGRIRLVWSKIWVILSDFFVKAGCHGNLGVSLYAIDSLRQLAMKFLEKDELASFQFQKQFFRPFELVMAHNSSVEARELIIQCTNRMVLARKRNIKSGWRAVFGVLAIAGHQSYPPLIQSSADLLSTIMEQNFALITEIDTMDECVNCLVAFASQTHYTEVSLQAVHYMTLVAAHMGAVPQGADGTRSDASTPRHRSGSISSASGAPLVAATAPASQLSVALATYVDEPHGSVTYSSMSAPSTPASAASTTTFPTHPALTLASQAHLLKVWFLLLTGLSRLVNDSRAEVRHLSLTTLFAILNENGHVFAASTWRAIFHGVLLPIFDDVVHTKEDLPDSQSPAAADLNGSTESVQEAALSQWVQTTCLEALSSLIQLFSRFYSTTHFLLPDLVRLLSGCMQQENEQLAKLGVDCLALLMKEGAAQWSVGSAWIVLETIMDVVKRTLPTPLLSAKVRQLLGLPPVKSSAFTRQRASEALPDDTDTAQSVKATKEGGLQEETKDPMTRSLTVDGLESMASPGSAPSPLSESARQRSASNNSLAASANLSQAFSTPLIHTRCKVQLLLLQALSDALQRCFPPRDGRVKSVLPTAQSHGKEGHFRSHSHGTPSDNEAAPLATQSASAAESTQPLPTKPPHVFVDDDDASVGRRRSSASSYHRRDDPRIFGHFLPSHALYCLSIFSLTLSFSHEFNADIGLRKKLYQAGFIIEQTGRLPQLFELEGKVTRFAWAAMFRLWKEGGTREALAAEADGDTEAAALLEEMEGVAPGREADVLASPRVLSIISAPASSSYAAAYQSSVLLSYHRMSLLTTRIVTDYLTKTQAGQLVSLEYVDDVVAAMVDAYDSLSLDLFDLDLDVMVPLIGELCEWGSIHVRGAVRRWIQGKAMRMAKMALRGSAEGEDEEAEEADGDDEDERPAEAGALEPAAVGPSQPIVGEGELIDRTNANAPISTTPS